MEQAEAYSAAENLIIQSGPMRDQAAIEEVVSYAQIQLLLV